MNHPYADEWSIAQRAGELVVALLVWVVAPICGMFVAAWCAKRWAS